MFLLAAGTSASAEATASGPGWSGSVTVSGSHDYCALTTDCFNGAVTAVYFFDGVADTLGPPTWFQPVTWTASVVDHWSGPCSSDTLTPGTATWTVTGQGTGGGGAQVSVGFGADDKEYDIIASTADFFAIPTTTVRTYAGCYPPGSDRTTVEQGVMALCAGRSSTSNHDRPDTVAAGVNATELHGLRTDADGAECISGGQREVRIQWDLVLAAVDEDHDGTADLLDNCPPSAAPVGATRQWGTPAVAVPATWNPDQADPCSATDDSPPETTIESGPSGATNDSTPTFTFSSSEPGSTFECSLDDGTVSFSPCASGDTFGPLADGSYTFRVRATDAASNTDPTPATRAFTVVAPLRHRLTVDRQGIGQGTITGDGIDCGATCSVQYDSGATVTLTATPDTTPGAESVFDHWSGACGGSGPCTVTMSADRSVTAVFMNQCGTPAPGKSGAPKAKKETWKIVPGQQLAVAAPGVLANDHDPDHGPLTAEIKQISFASSEWSGLARNGSFTYNAGPGTAVKMTKSITYCAVDSDGVRSAPVTSTVTITKPKPKPKPKP